MQTERCTFFSDGLELSGNFYLPDKPAAGPQPLIVPCSGFTGLARIHPERFARYLTGHGYICFGFDYRGFADSKGTRNRVLLEDQVRDIRHAVGYAAGDQRIDSGRIILLGWGMGAGLVIDAARQLPGVIGLIACNGFYNGLRFQKAHRGEQGLEAFLQTVDEERRERARSGEARRVDPFDIYPLDPQSRQYVDEVLRKTEQYDASPYSYELAESLLRWDVEAYAPRMKLPLLIAHGDRNRLHPVDEAHALYEVYGGPKEIYWVENGGHTEWMLDEHPLFQSLGSRIAHWLDTRLSLS